MAFLQFLTGSRLDELIELNPSATLILGSSPDSHIQISDPDVAPTHCQVYPAEGQYWLQDLGAGMTILNMRRMAGETDQLRAHDVCILGRTFVKFLTEPPAALGGGGGGGGGGEELATALKEIDTLKEEINQLWARNKKGEELCENLSEKLGEAKERMEKARRRVKERDDEIHDLRQQRGLMDKRLTEIQKELSQSEAEVSTLRKAADLSEEKIRSLETEVEGRDSELEKTRSGQKTARVDAKRLRLELDILDKQSKEELEKAKQEAQARVKEVEGEMQAVLATLEETRAALEGLGVQRPASELGAGTAPELVEILATVPDEQRPAVLEALLAHVDRESLRRFSGPPVGWIRPQNAIERNEELVSLRNRAERLDLALSMDVDP